jgi:transposase
MDAETHQAVFRWVLEWVAETGLLKGKTIGIDATTLEANAAMRSIVRRDTGEATRSFCDDWPRNRGSPLPHGSSWQSWIASVPKRDRMKTG